MSTTETKPDDGKSSREIAAGVAQLENLLTNAKLGARVSGILLSADEVRHFSGKNNDGSVYNSYSRRLQLFAGPGAGAVICGERQERPEDFKDLRPGMMIDTAILGCKTEGKQMVFRVKL